MAVDVDVVVGAVVATAGTPSVLLFSNSNTGSSKHLKLVPATGFIAGSLDSSGLSAAIEP